MCRWGEWGRNTFVRVLGVVAIVAPAGYFVLAFLYLAPPNPVKLAHLHTINALINPLFSQNWHLFAPNPIRRNYVLTTRCELRRAGVTKWHDLTQPMVVQLQRNRNSPAIRLLRLQQNAIRATLGARPEEWRPLICSRDPQHPICRGQDPTSRLGRDLGLTILRKIAQESCTEEAADDHVQAVQIRIIVHDPPPWSERYAPASAGSVKAVVLPWMRQPNDGP